MGSVESIKKILDFRSQKLSPEIRRRVESSEQVVVFGSYAVGAESASSDLDVFCLGDCRMHYKTPDIEIFVLPEYDAYSDIWLGSELACHISFYGIPLQGRPNWFDHTFVSDAAMSRKSRRIGAYVRALGERWDMLGTSFRSRYSIKVRRELQRLLLLENRVAVPPTKLLDQEFRSWAEPGIQRLCSKINLDQDVVSKLSIAE